MHYLVTGGAGFIGSHIVDRLIETDHVTIYDNFSSGRREFISHHLDNPKFKVIEADTLDLPSLIKAMDGIDIVIHLASNPDVRHGTLNTGYDLEQGTIATYNVLEAMRQTGVRKIAFSSSQTVYGEQDSIAVPEDYGPMIPISLYGASKLACEGLVSAYANSFDMQAWIFRFANIIGRRATHGVIIDFIAKLKNNSDEMEILGDGTQSKSYLLVEECVDAMIYGIQNSDERVNLFNLGCSDWVDVTRIAEIVAEEIGLPDVEFTYTGGERGWHGDVPRMRLSIEKIAKLGWKPGHDSEGAVRAAVKANVEEAGTDE